MKYFQNSGEYILSINQHANLFTVPDIDVEFSIVPESVITLSSTGPSDLKKIKIKP